MNEEVSEVAREETRPTKSSRDGPDLVALVVGLALLAAAGLLFTLRESTSPFLLGLALILLIYPYRRTRAGRVALLVAGVVFVAQFVAIIQGILFPFALSLGFAYLLDPLVDVFERRGLSRTLTILVLDVLVLGGIVFALVVLIPRLISEVGQVIEQIVRQAPAVENWYRQEVIPYLDRLGLDTSRLTRDVVGALPDRLQGLLRAFLSGILNASTGLSNLLGQLLTLILVPFLTFYLLRDFDRIRHQTKELLIPVPRQEEASRLWRKMDRILSGFIRGQLIVCVIVGVLTGVGLFLVGVRYSLALGILAGALNIVPYVGITITLIVAVLIGLFSASPWIAALKAVLVIEAVQVVEGAVLSPRIVGDRVGLHPVWVILAVLLFSKFMGVVGLLIAVPVTAVAKELIVDYLEAKRAAERDAYGQAS